MKNSIEFLDKVVLIIEPPYLYNLSNYGITEIDEITYVYNKLWDPVKIDCAFFNSSNFTLIELLTLYVGLKELGENSRSGFMIDFIDSIIVKCKEE